MPVNKQLDERGSCRLPYIEKSLNKSPFKMEVYISRLLYNKQQSYRFKSLGLLKLVQKENISPNQIINWQLSLWV